MKNKLPKITLQHFKNLRRKEKLIEYTHKLFSISREPKHFALSVALGIFIGLFIPMGLQTAFIVPISVLLGCNLIIAWIFTLVSNPVTVIPIYIFIFNLGEKLTGLTISAAKLDSLFNQITFGNILELGKEGLIIFFTGAFAISTISALLAYAMAFYLMKFYNKKYLSHHSI